jgi:hypothetical protein
MLNVTTLAPVLQTLFTTRADECARSCGFICRQRRFSGAQFLQTLVHGLLQRPNAPLEDLALPLGLSRQALHQRFTPAAAQFCRSLLLEAVGHALQARPATLPLLHHFTGVFIDDATQLWLPDAAAVAFPGCGSGLAGLGQARMKVLLRWEIQGGRLQHLGIHPGRTADPTAATEAPPLPAGALSLSDLAFADFDRLQTLTQRGVYWITKLPVQTRLYLPDTADVPLWQQLRNWRRAGRRCIDTPVRVGNKSPLSGRLVALACPKTVVQKRLQRLEKSAKRRGRPISARQREMCYWTVFLSNVPTAWLTAEQVWLLYRVRWQIELLFKRFKSEGGLGASRSQQPYRVECEWYLKLLGQVVRHWLSLLHGGPLLDVNGCQVGRVIGDWLGVVFWALGVREQLEQVLSLVQRQLNYLRRRTHRRHCKTLHQQLHEQGATASRWQGPPRGEKGAVSQGLGDSATGSAAA